LDEIFTGYKSSRGGRRPAYVLERGTPIRAGYPPLRIVALLRHREAGELLAAPATAASELVSMGRPRCRRREARSAA
jgi:hypothetical protein